MSGWHDLHYLCYEVYYLETQSILTNIAFFFYVKQLDITYSNLKYVEEKITKQKKKEKEVVSGKTQAMSNKMYMVIHSIITYNNRNLTIVKLK